MNTRKPTNWGAMNQIPFSPAPCASTMSTSEIEPAVITTPSRERPIATSYEINCAAERIEPRNEYLEPDAQPPSTKA